MWSTFKLVENPLYLPTYIHTRTTYLLLFFACLCTCKLYTLARTHTHIYTHTRQIGNEKKIAFISFHEAQTEAENLQISADDYTMTQFFFFILLIYEVRYRNLAHNVRIIE